MKYVILLVCLMSRVLGNGGGYHVGVDFTGSVAPFSPVGTEQVQILDEKLEIVLKHKHAEVKVRYLMRNVGAGSAKVKFGFPVEDVADEWAGGYDQASKTTAVAPLYCRDYSVVLNGKLLKHDYLFGPFGAKGKKVKPFAGSERFMGIEAWMVSEMKIAKGKDVVLEISYQSVYDEQMVHISDDENRGPWLFKYRLSTGGVWHGPIKKGMVTVRADGVDFKHVKIWKPVNRFKKQDDVWIWKFENLEPTQADDLQVHARPKYERYSYHGDDQEAVIGVQVRDSEWYMEHTRYDVSASSVLPDQDGLSYAASNVKNLWNEAAYAWVEGKPGDGIGESLTLTLKKAGTVNAVIIKNGYGKTDSLFKANSRVKEMTLVINSKTKMKSVLQDDKDIQVISLNSYQGDIKTIQLVIDSVYPGSKYRDTCLSTVYLLEKLKQKPKRYGAR